jgi:DNA-binding transcriptional ArsR family regulator
MGSNVSSRHALPNARRSDETRDLRASLPAGEQTVGALTAQAGISQPAVSKHLRLLKQAGLARDRHHGRQTHYRAEVRALSSLIDWTSEMKGFWQSRFDGLEDLLKRMDQ